MIIYTSVRRKNFRVVVIHLIEDLAAKWAHSFVATIFGRLKRKEKKKEIIKLSLRLDLDIAYT